MKNIFKVFLLVGVLSLGLTACGSSEDDETTKGGNGSAGEINVVSREDGSGTRDAFIDITGVKDDSGDNTFVEAAIQNSTDGVLSTVSGDKEAIGYISLGSLNDIVKAVKVDGKEASVEAIKSGEYPIARPFNIIYDEAAISEEIKDFINFIHSTEGQAIVEETGYISAGDSPKAYDGDGTIKSQITIGGSTSVTPVMEKLAEAYKNLNENVEINIEATGSGAGVTGAIDGTLDIGMASRELKDEEVSKIHGEVIALDGIAVIVNKDNPIEDLSLENIAKIFKGEARTWEEVK